MDMRDHDNEAWKHELGPSWKAIAYGLGTLVLATSGYLIGDTLTSLRHDLREVRATLDARASLPPRLETLERTVERKHEQYDSKFSDLERRAWEKRER